MIRITSEKAQKLYFDNSVHGYSPLYHLTAHSLGWDPHVQQCSISCRSLRGSFSAISSDLKSFHGAHVNGHRKDLIHLSITVILNRVVLNMQAWVSLENKLGISICTK